MTFYIRQQGVANYPKLSVSVGNVPIFHVRFHPLLLVRLHPRLGHVEKSETGDVDSAVYEVRKIDFVQGLQVHKHQRNDQSITSTCSSLSDARMTHISKGQRSAALRHRKQTLIDFPASVLHTFQTQLICKCENGDE